MKKSKLFLTINSILIVSTMMLSCVSTPSNADAEDSENNQVLVSQSDADDNGFINKKEFIKSLENISVKIVSAPRIATIGSQFVRPFVVAVTDNTGTPVSDFALTIKYPSEKKDGKIIYKTEDVETDESGKYSFNPGVLTFAGCGDFSAYPTPLVSGKDVTKAIDAKTAITPWDVKSDLASKGCLLVTWDFYENGNPWSGFSDLQGELRSARGIYNVGNAPASGSDLIGKSIESIYKDNYEIVGGDAYGYLVYATVKFSKPVTEIKEGGYTCALVGDMTVLNMSDGSVALTKVIEQEATGKNWNDVVTKCKRKLASKLADSLLYDLN